MPPVFGPGVAVVGALEVLRARAARAHARRRRARRRRSPRLRAAPRSRCESPNAVAACKALRRARAWSRQTNTPFAGGEAVGLDHAGRPRDRQRLRGRHACCAHDVLGERLRPFDRARPRRSGRRRARRRGAARRRRRRRAAPPGPTTTRSASSEPASARRPSPSSARTGWQRPSAAMPGLPGAAWSSSRSGAWLSFQASACSRPPEPTRSTFTRGL